MKDDPREAENRLDSKEKARLANRLKEWTAANQAKGEGPSEIDLKAESREELGSLVHVDSRPLSG